MTARDRWELNFQCPVCGRIGSADLSQADGWAFMKDQSTRVDNHSEGFDYRLVDNRIKFFCVTDQVDTIGISKPA